MIELEAIKRELLRVKEEHEKLQEYYRLLLARKEELENELSRNIRKTKSVKN